MQLPTPKLILACVLYSDHGHWSNIAAGVLIMEIRVIPQLIKILMCLPQYLFPRIINMSGYRDRKFYHLLIFKIVPLNIDKYVAFPIVWGCAQFQHK